MYKGPKDKAKWVRIKDGDGGWGARGKWLKENGDYCTTIFEQQ